MNTTTKMKSIPYEAAPREEGVRFEQVVTVKRIIFTTALLLVCALVALGAATAHAAPASWHSDFEQARHQAQRLHKPLLVMIARTGCHACAEMEQNLANQAARRALSNAVKVRLESSEYPTMTARYAAGGTPTTLVYSPGNYQSPVYTYTGVMSRDTILQLGQSINSLK